MGTGLYITFTLLLIVFNLFAAKVVKEYINPPSRWIKISLLIPPIGFLLAVIVIGYYAGLMLGEIIKEILN